MRRRLLGAGCWCAVVLGLLPVAAARAQDKSGGGARFIPAEKLAVYLEFDGFNAHAEGWHKTAMYRVLNETSAGAMFDDLAGQILQQLMGPERPGRPAASELKAAFDHVAHHGLTVGLCGPFERPDQPLAVIVLGGAAQPDVRALFDRLLQSTIPQGRASREVKLGERTVTVAEAGQGPSFAYWTEGQDVVVAIGNADGAKRVVAVLGGDQASAASHPLRAALQKREEGVEPVRVAFVDLGELPDLPPKARELGLDGVKRIESVVGFQGEAIVSSLRIVAPKPRRGFLTLLDQPTFDAKSMPPMPAGLIDYTVFSLDGGKLLDTIRSLPDGERQVGEMTQSFRRQTGLRLREDVLDTMGPRWAFFVAPEDHEAGSSAFGGLADIILHPPRVSIVAQVRDEPAFRAALKTLFRQANDLLAARRPPDRPAPRIEPLEGDKGYVLSVPPEVLPLPAGVRPTLVFSGKDAVLSISSRVARRVIEGKPDAETAADLAKLGGDLIMVRRSDPRGSLPEIIANIPFFLQVIGRMSESPGSAPWMKRLAQLRVDPDRIPDPDAIRPFLFPSLSSARVTDDGLDVRTRMAFPDPTMIPMPSNQAVLIALLLPAVQSAREAARRAQCTNNLKQMALAAFNYESAYGHFPAAAIAGKDGKPLLSWRVAILPFIEQNSLYQQFHLDEPWDSPHNKELISKMPQQYTCPSSIPEPGMTHYQVLVGPPDKGKPGTAFQDPTKACRIADITDGTSNTLMVVEAKAAVPWTKPEDVPFDPGQPLLPSLGSNHAGGFNAALCDGSVRFLKLTINEIVLKALATRNGGEVISADSY
jgi:prepilin-type processing-associated H-X9-DG protein